MLKECLSVFLSKKKKFTKETTHSPGEANVLLFVPFLREEKKFPKNNVNYIWRKSTSKQRGTDYTYKAKIMLLNVLPEEFAQPVDGNLVVVVVVVVMIIKY